MILNSFVFVFQSGFFFKLLNMKDLKYLIAYILPVTTLLGLLWQGSWAWATVILIFGILPIVEIWTPESTLNVPETQEDSRSKRHFFDLLLYANAPILFGIVGYYLFIITHNALSTSELVGLSLGVGLVVGACGINVAHELGHRQTKGEQFLSKLMLLPALYQHFFIEHNRGHHKNVATDLDPATARYGELLYTFWLRSIFGGWRGAWNLESERLEKLDMPVLSPQNEMLRFQVLQIAYLGLVYAAFGLTGLLGAVAVALVGILLLETVNYLEHYGLQRKNLASGRFEPVSPEHSWNSNHDLGRIFLYELTRHSDHHFKATRKYQILRHMNESPQLPFGYPTSLLMALVPPLWFMVMNPKVKAVQTANAA
jgi:alkane 1-monooxygenase